VVITDLVGTYESLNLALQSFDRDRVLLPRLLGVMKNRDDVSEREELAS
jgi:hypothetical protein